jgi:hypothetical protein
VVNTKVVHLDEVLDEVQIVVRVWYKNLLREGLKVGYTLKMAHMTIITCNLEFAFLSFSIWFFLTQMMLLSVEMV